MPEPNPYLDVAKQMATTPAAPAAPPTPAGAPANPYLDVASQMAQDQSSRLAGVGMAAAGITPDTAAKTLDLSDKTGMDKDLVGRNLDQINAQLKQQTDQNTLSQIQTTHPATASWMGEHPANVAAAMPDLDKAKAIESTAQDLGFWKYVGMSAAHGAAGLVKSFANVPALADTIFKGVTGEDVMQKADGTTINLADNPISKWAEAHQVKMQVPELDANALAVIKTGNVSNITRTLAMKASNMVPMIGAMMATGPAALFGTQMASDASAEGNLQGLDPTKNALNSVGQGLIGAAVSYLRFGPFEAWGKALAESLGKDSAQKIIGDVAKHLVYSSATGYPQMALQSVASDVTSYATGANPNALQGMAGRANAAGVEGALVNPIIAPLGMAGHTLGRSMELSRMNSDTVAAEAHRDAFTKIADNFQEMDLAKKAPAAAEQLLAKQVQGTPAETTYVDPKFFESYCQSKNILPDEMAKDLGVTLDESRQTGGYIEVPTSKFVATMAKDGHLNAFKDHVSFDPQVETYAQTSQRVTEAHRVATAQADQPAPAPGSPEAAKSAQQIEDQLRMAGRTKAEAQAGKSIWEKWLNRRSDITKKSVGDLTNSMGLKITHEGGTTTPEAWTPLTGLDRGPGPEYAAKMYKQGTDQPEKQYRDPNTGTLNARAWTELEKNPPADKPFVAHISVEGGKYVNDTEGGGHKAGNDLYKYAGQALMGASPDVAKVGGDFAVRVKDQADLDAILQKANDAMPEKAQLGEKTVNGKAFNLTGAIGDNLESAKDAHVAVKQGLETSGERSIRGAMPKKYAEYNNVEATPPGEAKRAIPEGLRQAAAKLGPEKGFQQAYLDPTFSDETHPVYSKDGYDALPKRAARSMGDMNDLKKINDTFNTGVGDYAIRHLMETMKKVAAEINASNGHEIDLAHLSGDELASQADDGVLLHQFYDEVAARLKAEPLEFTIDGKDAKLDVSFSSGIGGNDALAEDRLRTAKSKSRLPAEPGDARVSSVAAGNEDKTNATADGLREPAPVLQEGGDRAEQLQVPRSDRRSVVESGTNIRKETSLYGEKMGAYKPEVSGAERDRIERKAWNDSPIGIMRTPGKTIYLSLPEPSRLKVGEHRAWDDQVKRAKSDGVPVVTKPDPRGKTPSQLASLFMDRWREGSLHDHKLLRDIDHETKGGTENSPDAQIDNLLDYFSDFRGHNAKEYMDMARAEGPAAVKRKMGGMAAGYENLNQSYNQPAYHGSPHVFDKFSLQKIGSGEGAQAYGWGLYFAGKKGIAEYYRNTLSANDMTIDGHNFAPRNSNITEIVGNGRGDLNKIKKDLADYIDEYGGQKHNPYAMVEDAREIINSINNKTFKAPKKGKVYEADIPEENTMIYWDKPLSKQPEKVKKALEDAGFSVNKYENKPGQITISKLDAKYQNGNIGYYVYLNHDYYHTLEIPSSEKDPQTYAEKWFEKHQNDINENSFTGKEIYNLISDAQGGPEEASKYLSKNYGITGIKYLDNQSRSKGEGTHNYVVFDDKLVQITHTYDQSSKNGPEPLGRTVFGPDGAHIQLGPGADKSTFFHETGHVWLHEFALDHGYIRGLDPKDVTPDQKQFLEDGDTLLKWLGIKTFDDLPGNTDANEKFAVAAEKYFTTGEAPTTGLRHTFEQLKTWLLGKYKTLKNITDRGTPVDLSPEIKGVMDRLLASDAEIKQAETQRTSGMDNELSAQMSPEHLAEYKKVRAEADSKANQDLAEQRAAVEAKRNSPEWTARRAALEKESRQELEKRPEYAIQAKMTANGMYFNRDEIPADLVDRIPLHLIGVGDEGISPDVAADTLGMASGADLLKAIADARPIQEVAANLADARLGKEAPDLFGQPYEAQAAAMKATHNDTRVKQTILQAEQMRRQAEAAPQSGEKGQDLKLPHPQALKDMAEKILGSVKAAAINPDKYLAAEMRAARNAGRQQAMGDHVGAFNHIVMQLRNQELYRQALEAKDFRQKALKDFDKFHGTDDKISKTRDLGLVSAGRAVLSAYGYGTKQLLTAHEYLEQVKNFDPDPDTYANLAEIVNGATQGAKPIGNLTLNELKDLHRAVGALWNQAQSLRVVEVGNEKHQIEDVTAILGANLKTQPQVMKERKFLTMDEGEKKNVFIRGLIASVLRYKTWADGMDGMKTHGDWKHFTVNQISDDVSAYLKQKPEVEGKLAAVLEPLKDMFTPKTITAPELTDLDGKPAIFRSLGEVFGAYLHAQGNPSNRSKLIRGYGWGAYDAEGHLDDSKWVTLLHRITTDGTFTKEHADAAQHIWDAFEELKPQAQQAHKAVKGYYFKEIKAEGFRLFGTDYRGGYVPAMADPMLDADAERRAEQHGMEASGNAFMFPTAGMGGFTKGRNEDYAAKLVIHPKLLTTMALDKELKYIHLAQHVREVGRLFWNKGFRAQMDAYDPGLVSDMVMPWLKRTAHQTTEVPLEGKAGKLIDATLNGIRRNTGINLMFANVRQMAQTIPDFAAAFKYVDLKHLAPAIYETIFHAPSMTQDIASKSPQMASRIDHGIYELNSKLNYILEPNKLKEARGYIQSHAYFMQDVYYHLMERATWRGVEQQALARGETPETARREADLRITETQGSVRPEDVSSVEAGPSYQKLATMFYNYFNSRANLMHAEHQKSKQLGGMAGLKNDALTYALVFAPCALAGAALYDACNGKKFWDENDDGDYLPSLMHWFFGSQLDYTAGMVPVLGKLGVAGVEALTGSKGASRVSISPAANFLEAGIGAAKAAHNTWTNGELDKRGIKDVMTLLGTRLGVPLTPLAKPFNYQMGVMSGDNQPTGPFDYARGLAVGR